MVETNDTVSPGSNDRIGLIALIAKTVGCMSSATTIKEKANACLYFIFPPV
jgi:hypothetical protein